MNVLHLWKDLRHFVTGRRDHVLALLGGPMDPRGIVLGCGFAGAAGFGVLALLNHDPIGWAYLAAAIAGYAFLQTRFVPSLVWLLIAGAGAWGGMAGAPGGWVETFYGLLLAGVASLPAAEPDDIDFTNEPQPNLSSTSTPVEESTQPAEISISTLGLFQVLVGGRDVTPQILAKRTVGGLWCYLLALAARNPTRLVDRSALASDIAPGMPRDQQRERLRRRLWDLQRDLGPELGGLVRLSRKTVHLDITETSFDVLLLHELPSELRDNVGHPIDGELVLKVRRVLDGSAAQVFLPDFERLAADAGIEPAAARRALAEARSHIAFLRSEVARLLTQQRTVSPIDTPRSSSASLKGETS
jgi:hypothetical protein